MTHCVYGHLHGISWARSYRPPRRPHWNLIATTGVAPIAFSHTGNSRQLSRPFELGYMSSLIVFYLFAT